MLDPALLAILQEWRTTVSGDYSKNKLKVITCRDFVVHTFAAS
jgi:hypothetical protein